MFVHTNRKTAKVMLFLLAVLSLVLLCGCASPRHYHEVEKKAVRYYREKYGLRGVTVEDSNVAGNNGLFGYLGVKDRAYEMSDGSTVYWDDSAEKFSDNAQKDEILKAFESQFLKPLLADFSLPMKSTGPVWLNRTGFDSFDDCVFTELYTGDIRAFLKAEQPFMSGFNIAVETTDREKGEQEITDLYDSLYGYVKGFPYAYIFSEGLAGLPDEDWDIDERDLNLTARAHLDLDDGISWYRQAYIEVYKDVFVNSRKSGFMFEEGDVLFEEAGNCSELQQMLDDAYYALLVAAEDNKNGGYMVHDQNHEKRVVLDNTDVPYFRLKLSERVIDALNEWDRIDVCFLDLRQEGQPLVMYYGPKSNSPFSVYQVFGGEPGKGEFDTLSPDYLYYFGTYHLEE